MSKDIIKNEFIPAVGGWKVVDNYKDMWGELEQTTHNTLSGLEKNRVISVAIMAMEAMSNPSRIDEVVKKIKEFICEQ